MTSSGTEAGLCHPAGRRTGKENGWNRAVRRYRGRYYSVSDNALAGVPGGLAAGCKIPGQGILQRNDKHARTAPLVLGCFVKLVVRDCGNERKGIQRGDATQAEAEDVPFCFGGCRHCISP